MDDELRCLARRAHTDPEDPIALYRISEARHRSEHFRSEGFGDFHILKELSRGFGTLYQARRPGQPRCALRIFQTGSVRESEWQGRLFNYLRRLPRPSFVAPLERGEVEDRSFVSMEWVPGRALDALLDTEDVPCAKGLKWIEEIARALELAHQEGFLCVGEQRNFQPSKVLIDDRGKPRLTAFLDFRPPLPSLSPNTDGPNLNMLRYLAPEVVLDDGGDHRADVYSLGVLLYRILTGVLPFQGSRSLVLLQAIIQQEAPRPSSLIPELGEDVDRVLAFALAKDPDRRYASAMDFADDVRSLRQGTPITRTPALSWWR